MDDPNIRRMKGKQLWVRGLYAFTNRGKIDQDRGAIPGHRGANIHPTEKSLDGHVEGTNLVTVGLRTHIQSKNMENL